MVVSNAPTAGAERNRPRPLGPTARMSRAYMGSSAVAPPRPTRSSSTIRPRVSAGRTADAVPVACDLEWYAVGGRRRWPAGTSSGRGPRRGRARRGTARARRPAGPPDAPVVEPRRSPRSTCRSRSPTSACGRRSPSPTARCSIWCSVRTGGVGEADDDGVRAGHPRGLRPRRRAGVPGGAGRRSGWSSRTAPAGSAATS